MKLINIKDIPIEELKNLPMFTSSVYRQNPIKETDGSAITVDYIRFPKGVKNIPHSHVYDQILIVTHGEGIFATENDKFNVKEGDICHVPANEMHWQGAPDDSDFTIISIV